LLLRRKAASEAEAHADKTREAIVKLLFVCTHNACRSILAEVIARELGGDRIEAASAGSSPAGQLHPLTLQYLNRHGYSIDGLGSKGFDDVVSFSPDVVITVCDRAASESCPVWLGDAVKVHWGLPDPSHHEGTEQERETAFDSVTARIRFRIEALLAEPFEELNAEQLADLLNAIGEQH
jgi:arsenate reductase